jgi:hypothetical protein
MRITEVAVAVPYIRRNLFFGSGYLSANWKYGFRRVFRYFYPSDIGIIGNVFVYGLIGTLFFFLPFVVAYRYSKQVACGDIFLLTCEYTLLFVFFSMFFNPPNLKDSGISIFLLCIIAFYGERPDRGGVSELTAVGEGGCRG